MWGLSGATVGLLFVESTIFGGDEPSFTSEVAVGTGSKRPLLRLACFRLNSASQSGFFPDSLLFSVEAWASEETGIVDEGGGGFGGGAVAFFESFLSEPFAVKLPKASWKKRI